MSTDLTNRDERGRFVPGHNLGGPGRPAKQQEVATLQAISAAFPPERIVSLLEEALIIAKATNSARGITAVVVEILDRLYGRPQIRVEPGQGDELDIFLARIRAARNAE